MKHDGSCLVLVLCIGMSASTVTRAQITDLMLSKAGDDVELDWNTGSSPYRVLRSDTPTFVSGNRIVAADVATGPVTDIGSRVPIPAPIMRPVGRLR